MKKPFPAVFITLAGAALLGSASPAVAQPKSPPQVTAVRPVSNVSLAKGGSILLTLVGSNLIYVSSADMVRADAPAKTATRSPLRPTPGVKVTFTGVRTATTLGILLEAPWSTPDELYVLRLMAGGEEFVVPKEVLNVKVYWPFPHINDWTPRKGPIGSIVTIRGKDFGDPSQPDKTQALIRAGHVGEPVRDVAAEIVSFSPTELKVKVPDGAIYDNWAVSSPGGGGYIPAGLFFDPLYIRTFPRNLFQEAGTLGILRFFESQFIFADGTQNSAFFPSSAMRGLGFKEAFYFNFPTYVRRVNLLVGSTNIRVRLNGSNRRSRDESLATTSLGMTVDGTNLKVDAAFESQGVEFVAEYETQDILSKKISWHKFLDINIDNLSISVALTPVFPSVREVRIQGATTTSSFNPGFVVLDTNISVDQTPIKDFIKSELEASLRNFFLSEFFQTDFLPVFGSQLQALFQADRVNFIDVSRADDGGMKLTGSTRPVR
jgi:hypothetical protein